MRPQHRLDLARLDPVPPDFELAVHPAEEFDRAVGPPARAVPGAVAAQPRRVRDEPPGVLVRPVDVAAGDARAGEMEFPRYPDRYRKAGGIDDAGGDVGQRRTERDAAGAVGRQRIRYLVRERADGRFSRPVVVQHAQPRTQGADAFQQGPARRLPAEYQHATGEQVGRAVGAGAVDERAKMRGDELEVVDGLRPHPVAQRIRVHGGTGVHEVQGAPCRERPEHHRVREVGGQRRRGGEARAVGRVQPRHDGVHIGP
ncbi:MAG: hypothetical protein AUG44_00025 [Actinobacteria bacterium 13_1_20CM_3_71_11]|nr:MAG: hypothetical protein AUG44_00025 [Actinobacteria bacterium 13_1_20CM_3_71_11]